MDYTAVGSILWAVAGLLIIGSVLGVGLALLLDRKPASPSTEAAIPAEGAAVTAVVPEAPPQPVDEKTLASRKAAYRRGVLVFIGLAVLTALEVWVASAAGGSPVFLFIIVLAKAGLILQYYMNLGKLWGEEEAH